MRHRAFASLLALVLTGSLGGQAAPPAPPKAAKASADTGFAAMQARGREAMGVDQYTSTHHFDALTDGGRIELLRNSDDSAGVAQIRAHIRAIAAAFKSGDFSTPTFVHMRAVPGVQVMAEKRAVITYEPHDLPRGAELRMRTADASALDAIHQFMAFQRSDHHAGGMVPEKLPPHVMP